MIDIIEKIDYVKDRDDGGVNLFINYSGWIDNSIEVQLRLMDKVEYYLDYIKSKEFGSKYPKAVKENTIIVLRLEHEPTELIIELSRRIVEWVEYHNAGFSYIVANS